MQPLGGRSGLARHERVSRKGLFRSGVLLHSGGVARIRVVQRSLISLSPDAEEVMSGYNRTVV